MVVRCEEDQTDAGMGDRVGSHLDEPIQGFVAREVLGNDFQDLGLELSTDLFLFPFGDVGDEGDGALDDAVFSGEWRAVGDGPDGGAIAMLEGKLMNIREAGKTAFLQGGSSRLQGTFHEVVNGTAQHFPFGVAEDFGHASVDPDGGEGGVNFPDADAGMFEQLLVFVGRQEGEIGHGRVCEWAGIHHVDDIKTWARVPPSSFGWRKNKDALWAVAIIWAM